jgi:membrane protein DedA with SNARE-associated domain
MSADMLWYALGRWRGARMLDGLRRPPSALTDRVQRLFRAHELVVQFAVRFLPELNPIAAGLAGASGITLARYLAIAGASAMTWATIWTAAGYLLPDVFTHAMAHLAR